MSITIHIGSFIFGIFIGFIFVFFSIITIEFFNDREDVSFSRGWHLGYEKGKKSAEESTN